jgi:outer membrane immunogenic protein
VKKRIAYIAALLAFGMTGAMAEEMAVPPSQFITSRVPYLAWTGFYVGVNGGFAWGNSSVAFAANDPAAQAGTCGGGAPKGQCITSVDFRRDGAVAGGQFGYNWQVNSQWLVGAEADYQWSNLDGSVSSSFRLGNIGATNMVASQTVESFGTVRARAGVLLTPPLLLYGTGGFAFGQVHENLRVPAVATGGLPPPPAGGFSYVCTIGTACFAGAASQTLFGWSAGAGAEYAITTNLIFRTELLYVHLSPPTATVTATAAAAGTTPASFAAGFSPVYFAVMRAGLNYKF